MLLIPVGRPLRRPPGEAAHTNRHDHDRQNRTEEEQAKLEEVCDGHCAETTYGRVRDRNTLCLLQSPALGCATAGASPVACAERAR